MSASTTDRTFTHADFGKEVRVEQYENNEVHLVFVATSEEKATNLADELLAALSSGSLNLTLMGTPTSVEVLQ